MKKLVVLHIDGLSAAMLQRAIDAGDMPNVKRLIDAEGYEMHRYRCGVPSTTPFAQAGILYGDNSEIPSFRWWDRDRGLLVKFGAGSTFKKVADRYFHGRTPLTKDGACIAACYPAGAADDFGIAYHDRTYAAEPHSRSAAGVLLPYLANPVHLGDWLWQTVAMVGRTTRDYATARRDGRHPARPYVATDVVEEIFVHHLTRYAVEQAMREGYSPIYAGFYAYDETAHAFGPSDPAASRVLKHVDHTIGRIAKARADRYEMLVLSDHGQIDTIPFKVSEMLPGRPRVTASGGLAHIYVEESAGRLDFSEVKARRPDLVDWVQGRPEVALVMARERGEDVLLFNGPQLDAYDDAGILRAQLSRLNSFESCGDLVLFGAFREGRQINFENQAGGHGSIGGEQLHPFLLAKKQWNLDTSRVRGAHELHPILCNLRDSLATSPPVFT
ncbi:MAG TPA: alkaline phosphatase family protein [Candidatus Dormibacteraeota bacterium]|nr:alkaline phosphatase family protein [Candidatus Dormibacteraeota bacterium]